MQLCAAAARSSHPEQMHLRKFRISGLPLEVTFVGSELCRQFTRSLSHLLIDAFEAQETPLRIQLWDETATNVAAPLADLRSSFEDVSQFSDGILVHSADRQICGHQNRRLCTLLHFGERAAVGWVRSAAELSRYEIGKPLQPILFAWYDRHNVQPLHAALVAKNGSGVLIGGAGGSGKSTTSLACTMSGFSYLADDYVGLLPPRHTEQTAYSLYASLWLEETHSKKFASVQAHRIEGASEMEMKQPFALNEVYPERMAVSCDLRAVVLPRIADAVAGMKETRLSPATPAEAMLRLAPSSILQLPFISPAAGLQRIAHLLRETPSFWLDLGTDLTTIAPCVEEALLLARRPA